MQKFRLDHLCLAGPSDCSAGAVLIVPILSEIDYLDEGSRLPSHRNNLYCCLHHLLTIKPFCTVRQASCKWHFTVFYAFGQPSEH